MSEGIPAKPRTPNTVIFDLGGVVLRWEPNAAFAQVLPEDEIEGFLTEISFPDWNRSHDAGRDWSEGEAELIARLPHRREAILAYRRYFELAIPGMVEGTSALLAELGQTPVPLHALTNWAADTFAETRQRFGVLNRFAAIMVSGEERLAKPDPAIFRRLIERHRLDPALTLFIDDSTANCEAAAALGLQTWRFVDAGGLRDELVRLGLLGPRRPPSTPIYHLVERSIWHRAELVDDYPWSSRGLGYDQAGFVHGSFREQIGDVRRRVYGDVADADLAVLRLEPGRLSAPAVVETGFPHLFAPLRPGQVSETMALTDLRGTDPR